MVTRVDVERDATAVLAFDDGQRVPCNRFIVRSVCGVIRRLLEDAEPSVDTLGRIVIPVPGQPSDPFWLAMDLLHGVRVTWTLELDEVLRVSEAMRYLEVTVHDNSLDSRLWQLIRQHADMASVLPHVPRMLRSVVTAGVAMRHLIQLRPLWAEFRREVLDALAPSEVDGTLVDAVVAYAPNFFPPHLVLEWALGACAHLSEAHAQRLASQHGVMCHPCEIPVVLRKLVHLYETHPGWSRATGNLMRSMLISIDKYDIAPVSVSRAHGTVIKFHDVPMASVCLLVDAGHPPARPVRVARWLSVTLTTFGISLKPRKIDELSATCTDLQLRIMVAPTSGIETCAEAWYLFDGIGDDDEPQAAHALSHASRVVGDVAGVMAALRGRGGRRLRLDFFFGSTSILHNPLDPTSSTRSAITFLLANSTTNDL